VETRFYKMRSNSGANPMTIGNPVLSFLSV